MDINNIMKRAQEMKSQLEKKTNEFNKLEFTVETQGIIIKILGNKTIKETIIDNELLKNKEDLEDLLSIAFNNALGKVAEENKKYLGPIMDNVPPGII